MTENAFGAIEILTTRYGRRILIWGQVRINAAERLVDGFRVCGFGRRSVGILLFLCSRPGAEDRHCEQSAQKDSGRAERVSFRSAGTEIRKKRVFPMHFQP